MRNIIAALAVTLVAVTASAADELKKLDFLVGEWKGEGWSQRGQGPREHVIQHERVTARAGGNVLVVEGTGRAKLENGTAGEIVHDAFGTIWWDAEKKQYRFVAHTAHAGSIEPAFDLGPNNTAVWAFSVPQGRIRYTIKLTEKGEWNEIGEFSRDGEKWMKFFEMTLRKVAGGK